MNLLPAAKYLFVMADLRLRFRSEVFVLLNFIHQINHGFHPKY